MLDDPSSLWAFLDLTEHGFFETDDDGMLVFANERFAGLLNVPYASLPGTALDEVIRSASGVGRGAAETFETLIGDCAPFEIEVLRKDRTSRVLKVSLQVRAVHGTGAGYRGAISDITEVRALTRTLVDQAHSDMLTGVGNRRAFQAWVQSAVQTALASNRPVVVGNLDLVRFKQVNDTSGHAAGDAILVQVVRRLKCLLRPEDEIARLNGDEFGVLFADGELDRARKVFEQMLEGIKSNPFEWDGRSIPVTLSTGIAEARGTTANAAELMRRADIACAQSKESGSNRIHVVRTIDDPDIATKDYLTIREIETAMETRRLHVVAMPIARISAGMPAVHHHEILIRLRDSDGKLQAPGKLIASAERLGVMPMVDKWIIERTLELLSDGSGGVVGINLNINLSGQSISDPEFAEWVLERIDRAKFWPGQMCFEITETSVVRNMQTAFTLLSGLRDRGCRIALDDFGSGLASFAYLMKFEADYLKIDGSIVSNVANDFTQRACVTAIVGLARAVRAETVAEYVEDEQTLNILRSIGVDFVQGHLIGKPVDLTDVTATAPLSVIDSDITFA